jgi:hypothetical protein
LANVHHLKAALQYAEVYIAVSNYDVTFSIHTLTALIFELGAPLE